jgi:hypothetical protein
MKDLHKVEQTEAGYVPILKIKGEGRIDLGIYPTMRVAAVAHDVARLIYIQEKRPGAVWNDEGTHFPLDAYKFDKTFTDLLDNGTSFADVCSLLRSGALADQFLCTQVGHWGVPLEAAMHAAVLLWEETAARAARRQGSG